MSAMIPLLNKNIFGKKKAKNIINNNNNSSSSIDNNSNSSVVDNSGSIDKGSVCGCVGVTVGLLILFAIFIFDPLHNDQDGIPKLEFHINSVDMKVYNNNVSNYYYSIIVGNTKQQQLMAGDLEFNLTVKNKEHGLMYFSPMEMSLEYEYDDPDELFLSSTMVEPFLLVEDQRQLQFKMQIKDDLQNRAVESIFRDLSDQNVVSFALKGKGRCVPLHRGVYYNCGINLLCDDIKARFLPANANNYTAGSMIVGPLLCKCNFNCHIV